MHRPVFTGPVQSGGLCVIDKLVEKQYDQAELFWGASALKKLILVAAPLSVCYERMKSRNSDRDALITPLSHIKSLHSFNLNLNLESWQNDYGSRLF